MVIGSSSLTQTLDTLSMDRSWPQLAEEIALKRHERSDGRGYPQDLASEDIPLSGIIVVTDFFDALAHECPYKKAWTREQAKTEMASQSGKKFDERVLGAFLNLT